MSEGSQRLNPYKELDLPRDCSVADVTKAYRRMAKRAHPDHGGTAERFGALKLARDVLMDAERRRKFDATGEVDPSRADNSEAMLWNCVVGAMVQASAKLTHEGQDFSEADVVDRAKGLLEERKRGLAANRAKADEAIAKWARLAERIERRAKDGKPNRLAASIAALGAQGEQEKRRMTEEVEQIGLALKVLAEYCSPAPAPVLGSAWAMGLGTRAFG